MTCPTILIIDDSQAIRLAVREVLGQAGFTICEAADGEEGRRVIEERDDISLVLCDVNMPRMDGLSMLEMVKADPRNAELPILMLTTEGEPGMVRRARDAGARGWIVKPFQPELLLTAVRRLAVSAEARAAK